MSSGPRLGTLAVVILKARHLKDSHTFYKQDPYAVIQLGGTEKKTNVDLKGGQHPVWDEEFHFPVREIAPGFDGRTLSVAAYSKEHKIDELIGRGKVDISDTLVTGEFDDWVKLELNGAYRGEIYLEMTYYSAAPPLARRPSKLSHKDRLLRPPPTPPKETTSPFLSPQLSPQYRPSSNTSNSPRMQFSSSPHLHPHSPLLYPAVSSTGTSLHLNEPRRLTPPPSLPTPPRQPYVDPTLKNIPFLDVGPSASSLHLEEPRRLTPPPSLTTPPRQPYVDPTLKNIPFLDVGPSVYTPRPAPAHAPALHSVPSILRPRNVKSSPVPIATRDGIPKDDLDSQNLWFQRELVESDAAFAARLAESEGLDVERLRVEEADAELARRLADEELGSGKSIPGGWVETV